MSNAGFFAIGIANGKTVENIGTLWRSAHLYGAAFVFTVGRRYKQQASDTMKTPNHIPLFHFESMDDLIEHLPLSCPLVGVELLGESKALSTYGHMPRAAYLLGAEDHGLSKEQIERCHEFVQIESARPQSMNVAVAGSIIMHHRHTNTPKKRTLEIAS